MSELWSMVVIYPILYFMGLLRGNISKAFALWQLAAHKPVSVFIRAAFVWAAWVTPVSRKPQTVKINTEFAAIITSDSFKYFIPVFAKIGA